MSWIWPANIGTIEGLPAEHGFMLTIDKKPVLFIASAHEQRWVEGAQFRKTIEIAGVPHEIVLSIGPQPREESGPELAPS